MTGVGKVQLTGATVSAVLAPLTPAVTTNGRKVSQMLDLKEIFLKNQNDRQSFLISKLAEIRNQGVQARIINLPLLRKIPSKSEIKTYLRGYSGNISDVVR